MQNSLGLLKLVAQGEKDISEKKYKKQNDFFQFVDQYKILFSLKNPEYIF